MPAKRTAKAPKIVHDEPGLFRLGFGLAANAVARNPLAVGGMTAFIVSLCFVSANALFYQARFHSSAFFSTRDGLAARFPDRSSGPAETRILIDRDAQAPVPAGDPAIKRIQDVLRSLNIYSGPVDGLAGPQTKSAIQAYQRIVGLEPTGELSPELVTLLGGGPEMQTGSVTTEPMTAHRTVAPAQPVTAPVQEVALQGDQQVVRIQAGLKAFGNDAIEVDGKVGAKTRAAIKEFQSLFDLPVTGEPDTALYKKMREIGLTE